MDLARAQHKTLKALFLFARYIKNLGLWVIGPLTFFTLVCAFCAYHWGFGALGFWGCNM